MNPYTYRRVKSLPQQPTVSGGLSSCLTWAKDIIHAQVSSATALAFVVFAAGAVGSITMVAYGELSNSGLAPYAQAGHMVHSKVLGDATYDYSQPVAVCKSGYCLNYVLLDFNGSAWAARIDYTIPSRARNTIMRENGNIIARNLSGVNSVYTNYILSSNSHFNIILQAGILKSSPIKVSLDFDTPSGYPATCEHAAPPSGCHYEPIAGSGYACAVRQICTDPGYGYDRVSTPTPAPVSWIEGWIDQVSYGSDSAPGSVKISGWAEDQVGYMNISMSLRNRDTGAEYKPVSIDALPARSDVVAYLARASGAPNPEAFNSQKSGFSARFENLPQGYYYIYNARYNSNLFNIHNQAYHPIIISAAPVSSFTITSPSGGEQWAVGSTQTIKWSAFSNTVSISLSQEDPCSNSGQICGAPVSLIPIASNVTNGYYSWTIPSTLASGKYKIFMTMSYPNSIAITSQAFSITANATPGVRAGQIINLNGTVYLVGPTGLYGFPTLEVFNSWGFSFSQIVTVNSAEQALSQIGVVPSRNPACSSPLDQINGSCGHPVDKQPFINHLSPTSGPDGTIVAVNGLGFTATGNIVKFNNNPINGFYSSSDGQNLTFQIPAGGGPVCSGDQSCPNYATTQGMPPGTYNVTVTNANGGNSNPASFTVTASCTPPPACTYSGPVRCSLPEPVGGWCPMPSTIAITVSNPQSGQNLTRGNTQYVSWTPTGSSGGVSIAISSSPTPCTKDSPCPANNPAPYTITTNAPDTGSFAWTVGSQNNGLNCPNNAQCSQAPIPNGQYQINVSRNDGSAAGASGVFSIISAPPTFSISGAPGSGTVGQQYSTSFSVSNPVSNHSYSISISGGIPGVYAVTSYNNIADSSGIYRQLLNLTGSPTQSGSFTITITATDVTNGQSLNQNYTVVINPAPAPTPTPTLVSSGSNNPSVDSVSPSSGSGSSQTFTATYSDPAGYQNLVYSELLFSSNQLQSLQDFQHTCVVVYNNLTRGTYLYNDNMSELMGPVTPGSSIGLQNSQCSIHPEGFIASGDGNTLQLKIPVTFSSSFTGAKVISAITINKSGNTNGGFQPKGSWVVSN